MDGINALPTGQRELTSTIKGGSLIIDVNPVDRPFRIPGDIITGSVTLQMARSFTLSGIDVSFRCEEFAAVATKHEERQLFKDKRLRGRQAKKRSSADKLKEDAEQNLINERAPRAIKRVVRHYNRTITLFDGKAPFAKGGYQFPFEFRVPLSSLSHAPISTPNGLNVGIKWCIKAVVRRPRLFDLVKMKTVVPVNVQSIPGLAASRSFGSKEGSSRTPYARSVYSDDTNSSDMQYTIDLKSTNSTNATEASSVLPSESSLPDYELRSLLTRKSSFFPERESQFVVSDMAVIKKRSKTGLAGMFAAKDATELIFDLYCSKAGIVQQPMQGALKLQATNTNPALPVWIRGLNVFLVQYCEVTIENQKRDTYLYRHKIKSLPLSIRLTDNLDLSPHVDTIELDKIFPASFSSAYLKVWYAVRVELDISTNSSQKFHDVASVESNAALLSPVLCWYEGNGLTLPPPPSPPPLDPLPPIPGVAAAPIVPEVPVAVEVVENPPLVLEKPAAISVVESAVSDDDDDDQEEEDDDDENVLSFLVSKLLSGSYASMIGLSIFILVLAVLVSMLIDKFM